MNGRALYQITDANGDLAIESFDDLRRVIFNRNMNLYRLPDGKLLVTPSGPAIADLMPHITQYKRYLLWMAVPYLNGVNGKKIVRMSHPLVPDGYYIASDDARLDGTGLHNGLPVLTYSEWQRVKRETPEQIAFILETKAVFGGSVVQSPPLPSELIKQRNYALL